MIQQPLVINLQKPLERMRALATAGGAQSAPDEQRRTLAHHPADLLLGQGHATELLDQLIRRFGEIAPRVDEGSVEIEGNQTA